MNTLMPRRSKVVRGGFPATFEHQIRFLHQRSGIDPMRHAPFGMDFFKQVNLSECHARVMGLSPAKRGISRRPRSRLSLM